MQSCGRISKGILFRRLSATASTAAQVASPSALLRRVGVPPRLGAVRLLHHPRLPPPTWSLKDLPLRMVADGAAEPLPPALLRALSRRALVRVPDDASFPQDLANMMRLIRQVAEWSEQTGGGDAVDVGASEENLYDVPRGVQAAPLRDDDDDVLTAPHPAIRLHKTVSVGSHKYFAIQTKQDASEP